MQPQTTPIELLDVRQACVFFGGTRPINPATLYRGIAKGRFPQPVKIGPGISRWLRSECETALRTMIAEREPNRRLPSAAWVGSGRSRFQNQPQQLRQFAAQTISRLRVPGRFA